MKLFKYLLMGSLIWFASCGSKEPVTIYMIGDSTMANKPLKNENQERGWGQALPDLLTEDILVDNHAVNGRSSRSFINEGRWDTVLARIKPGDYVFIQFGHNDEKPDEKRHTDPGSTFDDNLRRFVCESRAKGAYPVLFNSIVRRNYQPSEAERKGSYDTEGDSLVDTHGAYLESPRLVAAEMNVPFVDMNKLSYDLVTGLGREKSKDLFMWIPEGVYAFCPKGKIDNTHLNRYGAKRMASVAIEAVAKEVPALAKYLRHYDPEMYVADYKTDDVCSLPQEIPAPKDSLAALRDSVVMAATSENYLKERKNVILCIEKRPNLIKISPRLKLKEKIEAEPLTMVVKKEVSAITVRQNGRELPVKAGQGVFLFDFDPFGGTIEVGF